jgi:uncharacterized protein
MYAGMEEVKDESVSMVETNFLRFRTSSIHGTGGFAKTRITRGTRLIEYVGEVVDKEESLRRCMANNPYIFTLDDHHDLDGNVSWNPARFFNHSCSANCDAELDDGRIWIIAAREIEPGEEVTINYGYDLADYKDYPCRCGAGNCVGYMVAETFFEHVRSRGG